MLVEHAECPSSGVCLVVGKLASFDVCLEILPGERKHWTFLRVVKSPGTPFTTTDRAHSSFGFYDLLTIIEVANRDRVLQFFRPGSSGLLFHQIGTLLSNGEGELEMNYIIGPPISGC